ncbi:MAG TPA: N-methyl-L-tryptophan oxidase [Roseiflexaceae bacterium]|nr:N-methyl-L-tryptophan oxidase [Roseiflexaceae bacterium]HMP43018.1 N-methyl-L-tryptophan oxidase [Roseiflexaceae bacterium]
MTDTYDTIIIGLGAMGSSAAYQLARRRQRVLGLERHTPAHAFGSSHGRSRIIRQAYMEGTEYVPLILRAYELWEALEQAAGERLLTFTGGLTIGPPQSAGLQGVIRSAEAYNLFHEVLDAAEVRRRFPPLQLSNDLIALYEQRAGVLVPEACINANLRLAAQQHAELHFEEPVLAWEAAAGGDRVRVTTARGSYEAERLIIAAGAWAPELLADLSIPFTIERQVLYWFDPLGGTAPFAPDHFPIYMWEFDEQSAFYGFPAQQGSPGGVKIAFHTGGMPCTPETIRREVLPDEVAAMRAALAERIPAINGRLLATATCMYTKVPDEHFVLGMHPHHPQVIVASPCSGHGFKFSSVIGEVLADLAQHGTTSLPISFFSPQRFVG